MVTIVTVVSYCSGDYRDSGDIGGGVCRGGYTFNLRQVADIRRVRSIVVVGRYVDLVYGQWCYDSS